MFEVGDEVMCIDDTIRPEMLMSVVSYYPNWVKRGTKYTVRGFVDNNGIVDGVLLEEISNPIIFIKLINRDQEPAFGLFRFAKSEEVSSEIEIEEEIYV